MPDQSALPLPGPRSLWRNQLITFTVRSKRNAPKPVPCLKRGINPSPSWLPLVLDFFFFGFSPSAGGGGTSVGASHAAHALLGLQRVSTHVEHMTCLHNVLISLNDSCSGMLNATNPQCLAAEHLLVLLNTFRQTQQSNGSSFDVSVGVGSLSVERVVAK